MPQIINTNVASLNAQRNLNTSQSQLGVALQRLSSGLRINSAKDDAAGLAISDRFTTQIRGLNQAARNASDGISLSQTAESALGELTVNLQRIRELAVQSANSTNSSSDRAALNQEVQQRLAEIDRISSQTSFNGQKILDGTFGEAQFQIGANAGEVIKIDLASSLRQNAIGEIASTTSQALGATATPGSINVATTSYDYGTAADTAKVGTLTVNAGSRLFGTVAAGQVDAKYTFDATAAIADYSTPAVAQIDATITTAPITDFDYSGGGANIAQFDISIDGGTNTYGITLSTALTDADGVAAEVQSQVRAATGNTGFTVTANGSDELVFTNVGSTDGIDITNPDANAATGGFAAIAGVDGTSADISTQATFTVDGTSITLDTDLSANIGAYVGGLQAKLDTAFGAGNYAVTNATNDVTITHTGSVDAVDIVANLGTQNGVNARTSGIVDVDGIVAGAAGTNTVATTNATFDIAVSGIGGDDTATITLDQDYATFQLLADDIITQLNGDADFTAGDIVATVTGNSIQFDRAAGTAGAGSLSVDITASDANSTAAGFAVANGTDGLDAVVTTNAAFIVDGQEILLNADYTNEAGLVSALNTALDTAFGADTYDVKGSGAAPGGTGIANTIQIFNNTNGTAAVVIEDSVTGAAQAITNAGTAGFSAATGTAGVSSGSIVVASGELSIQVGDLAAVELSGTFTSFDDFATYINSNVSGVFASEGTTAGSLKLQSAQAIVLSGTQAVGGSTDFNFAAANVAVDTGSLATTTVATVDGSNDTIIAVDSALTRVSSLRSNFGAIQSRFESTIANLTTTSENLSAARSRILDADFAQETAALTRAQILQQAGVSILSQANSLPQLALSLLQ